MLCTTDNIRFFVVLMATSGLGISYIYMVNIHIAIVHIMKDKRNGEPFKWYPFLRGTFCPISDNDALSYVEVGNLDWTTYHRGLILCLYFLGYIIGNISAYSLENTFRPKLLVSIMFTIMTAFNCTIPFMDDPSTVMGLRFGLGLCAGVTFVGMEMLMINWIPAKERPILVNACFTAIVIGTFLGFLTTGFLCSWFHYKISFLMQSLCGGLWVTFWAVIVTDKPEENEFISEDEKMRLMEVIRGQRKRSRLPLKKVFCSLAFWALIITHAFHSFGFYFLLVEMPRYYTNIYKFMIQKTAIATSMPYLCFYSFSMAYGKIMSCFDDCCNCPTIVIRKISTAIACLIPAGCCYIIDIFECNIYITVAAITVMTMTFGAQYEGFYSNHIDIAPHFAGQIMMITNTIQTVMAVIAISVTGELLDQREKYDTWMKLFHINAVFYILAFVVFTLFGSAKVQSWDAEE